MALIKGTCDEWEAIKERKEQEHKEQIKRIQDLVNGFDEVDDAIERHSNIVADAIFNGESQEDVMKKAMDFTKEIDEMKGKETHWDKKPGMIQEHSSDFYDAQWASAEENKRRLDTVNEALKCDSWEWEPTAGDKYARAFLSSMNDPVRHPSHYTEGKYECINYIHCKDYGFDLGNAVKYITRAGKKSPDKKIEDLRKAMQYLDFYLKEVTEPIEDYIPTVQYCDDKELSMLLTAALIHIDHAHTTPMVERKRTYSEVAKACIEAYISKLANPDGEYDTEMVGNRTE